MRKRKIEFVRVTELRFKSALRVYFFSAEAWAAEGL